MKGKRIPVFRKDQKLSRLSGDADAARMDWLQSHKARVGWAYTDQWIVCDAAQNTITTHPESIREAIDAAIEITARCPHDRLNEDGICRKCGEDRRGF